MMPILYPRDGRYIAFHAPKPSELGYEIKVADTVERTVRTIDGVSGSSYFPSWTNDGRLLFHSDGDDFRGFMIASDYLALPATPLASEPAPQLGSTWTEIFPETPLPGEAFALVLVWGPWSAHAPQALRALQAVRRDFVARSAGVRVLMAADPGSRAAEVERAARLHAPNVPRIQLAAKRLIASRSHNQNPTALLFQNGELIDERLGALSYEELRQWILSARDLARPRASSG